MIVAQLSDIHADGSGEALDRLERVLSWLKPMRPDAVIISGDLAEADQKESYRQVRQRLDGVGCPWFAVPGNVDDHSLMRSELGDRFGWQADRPLNVSARLGDLQIIGLDVTVDGAHHGDAGPVLGWLGEHLQDGVPALIFQHQHPFACGIDGKDRNMCYGGAELAAVIEASSAIGLTCGHVHRPMFTRFGNRPATMAPSIARANRLRLDGKESAITDPPGLLLHHVGAAGLVTHVVMVP